MSKFILSVIFIFFSLYIVKSQNILIFNEDYSNSTAWTQIGNLVEINNGRLNYISGASDGQQRRVYRPLDRTLNNDDCWRLDFEFTPESTSTFNGASFPGHTIVALTESTQEPLSDCPDIPCTGNPNGTQDAIFVVYSETNPPSGSPLFKIIIKDGPNRIDSQDLFYATLGQTFYISLEKNNQIITLSIYSDVSRTIHIPSSPISINSPVLMNGLSYIQHGNVAAGREERGLTGFIDNTRLNLVSKGIKTNNIPTLGEWSLIILSLIFLIMGVVSIKSTSAYESVLTN